MLPFQHLIGQFWADHAEQAGSDAADDDTEIVFKQEDAENVQLHHFAQAYAPRLGGIRATTNVEESTRTISIPCMMNVHNHATVFRFDNIAVVSSSTPMKVHARSGSFFVRQTAAGYNIEAAHALLESNDDTGETYDKSECDFTVTVRGTVPITIHAAAMTTYMGSKNVLLRRVLPLFGNATDVIAVDAIHASRTV